MLIYFATIQLNLIIKLFPNTMNLHVLKQFKGIIRRELRVTLSTQVFDS